MNKLEFIINLNKLHFFNSKVCLDFEGITTFYNDVNVLNNKIRWASRCFFRVINFFRSLRFIDKNSIVEM